MQIESHLWLAMGGIVLPLPEGSDFLPGGRVVVTNGGTRSLPMVTLELGFTHTGTLTRSVHTVHHVKVPEEKQSPDRDMVHL